MLIGTVGKPLPGVEVRISDPDPTGVGEVIARGPNVMLGYYEDEASTRKTLVDRWLYTGDLGRVDDDGNLYLVGRSKEIIVDTNGKNVYPDELEEVYANSPYIKELSIVGLPDGIGEKVACLVVADDEYDISLSRAALHRQVEEHFREVSASLPYYKRVKVLHFTDVELPRTATRKVKRREVVQIMESLEESQKTGRRGGVQESANADALWLVGLVATVANRSRSEVSIDSRLSDLGFDSLMFVELASAIERCLYEAGIQARRTQEGRRDPRAFVCSHGGKQSRRSPATLPLRSIPAHALRRTVEHSAAHELHRRCKSLFSPRHGPYENGAR
jgi:long-chain acyl-CoA synthetase